MTDPQNPALLVTGRRAQRCPFEPAAELTALREQSDLPSISGDHPFLGHFDVRAVTATPTSAPCSRTSTYLPA